MRSHSSYQCVLERAYILNIPAHLLSYQRYINTQLRPHRHLITLILSMQLNHTENLGTGEVTVGCIKLHAVQILDASHCEYPNQAAKLDLYKPAAARHGLQALSRTEMTDPHCVQALSGRSLRYMIGPTVSKNFPFTWKRIWNQKSLDCSHLMTHF